MLQAVFVMGSLGILIGIVLAIASKVFYVYVDPKILAVDEALPGANCGGCGFPGCSANAEAIIAGKSAPDSCVAGGAEIANEIAGILGVSVEAKEPDIALSGCAYGTSSAELKFEYSGINDCRAASLLHGGMKVCDIGCLGLGTCQRACPFGAITMGEDNLPKVDEARCTGCGTCERVCPKHIISLSSVTRRIMREYTTEECTTPCQRACPAGIDIREYIDNISNGDYLSAVQVIKERNPFPAIIGRICPRPCETQCRRNLIDEPVAINALKRFAADFEKDHGRVLPFKAPETGRKIAVIGGGIEGLSTAFFTARLGHSPTVYEAAQKPGGLLRTAIAKYRLPDNILDYDIEGLKEMGVEIKTGECMGVDFTVDSLLAGEYDAVFLASGGWDNRLSRSAGNRPENPIPGTYLLIDLLRSGGKAFQTFSERHNIVISGGAKSASAAVKILKDLGAINLTLVFREKSEDSGLNPDDIQAMENEGAKIIFNSGLTMISGEETRLSEVEIMDLDSKGKNTIPADTLFLAAGRFPELIFSNPKSDEGTDEKEVGPEGQAVWQAVPPYKDPAKGAEDGLLSKADPITDFSAAIRAIGSGRRAAASIHQQIYGIDPELSEHLITNESLVQNVEEVHGVEKKSRNLMPIDSGCFYSEDAELEKGYSEATAKSEAERCLQCGLICYKHGEPSVPVSSLIDGQAPPLSTMKKSGIDAFTADVPENFNFSKRRRVY